MQIRALYDKTGRILAAVQRAASGNAPVPEPKPKRGQRVGLFTVPAESAHLSFAEACAQLVVKTDGKKATLVQKAARRRR